MANFKHIYFRIISGTLNLKHPIVFYFEIIIFFVFKSYKRAASYTYLPDLFPLTFHFLPKFFLPKDKYVCRADIVRWNRMGCPPTHMMFDMVDMMDIVYMINMVDIVDIVSPLKNFVSVRHMGSKQREPLCMCDD